VTIDWRTGAEYPDPRHTGVSQWAWEFLRRNPNYKADWRRYADTCERLRAKYGSKIDGEPTAFAFEREDVSACEYQPRRRVRESEAAWRRRVRNGSVMPLGHYYADKWGIDAAAPPDPSSTAFRAFWLSSKGKVRVIRYKPAVRARSQILLHLEYDLTRPLQPQFSAAQRYLTEKQKKLIAQGVLDTRALGRARRGMDYLRYLRVLDGLEEGANASAIAQALFPGEDADSRDRKMRKTIVEARRLRDSGYRLLPGLSATKKRRNNKAHP
jgi:hypothetical protein